MERDGHQSLSQQSSSQAQPLTYTFPLRPPSIKSSHATVNRPSRFGKFDENIAELEEQPAKPTPLQPEWSMKPVLETVQKPDQWDDENPPDPGPSFRVSASISVLARRSEREDAATRKQITLDISIVCTPMTLRSHHTELSFEERIPFSVDQDIEFLDPSEGVPIETQVQAVELIMYFARRRHGKECFTDEAALNDWGYRTLRSLKR